MLTTVRTHGFAADPELPQRDRLLDADAVAERLPGLLGLGSLRSCNLLRAKYRIGESLRVVYRLDTGSREHLLAARAFPAGRGGSAYRRAVIAAVPVDGLPPVVLDQESEAVWWTFPNDRRLLGLSDLMHPLGSVHPSWQRSEAVEYAPERSVTLRARALDGKTAGYAKVFAPGSVDVAELAGRYRRIAAALAGAGRPSNHPTCSAGRTSGSCSCCRRCPGSAGRICPPQTCSEHCVGSVRRSPHCTTPAPLPLATTTRRRVYSPSPGWRCLGSRTALNWSASRGRTSRRAPAGWPLVSPAPYRHRTARSCCTATATPRTLWSTPSR